ncbi:right-handed parallel beta-helix repeat-containing protein [Desulforudis sp. 1088]|uniref:right-handed parallel beta-helix repeat-containing protein n=1 Tax=unclassified Candidatus Desulforudis TaxID=2635950 RepID=UPI003CE45BB5
MAIYQGRIFTHRILDLIPELKDHVERVEEIYRTIRRTKQDHKKDGLDSNSQQAKPADTDQTVRSSIAPDADSQNESPPPIVDGVVYRELRVPPGINLPVALTVLQDGGTLYLESGLYYVTEPLVIEKAVNLIGPLVGQAVVVCESEGWVTRVTQSTMFRAERITFQHCGSRAANVVEIWGGIADIENCRFIGAVNEQATGRGGIGLLLFDVKARIIRCSAFWNEICGIQVAGEGDVTAGGNYCFGNGGGICYADEAAGSIEWNNCYDNRCYGICMATTKRVKVSYNKCLGNGVGIEIAGRGEPTLRRNTCSFGEIGISYGGDSGGTAEENTCEYNAYTGILINNSAHPLLKKNRCSRNRCGVEYRDSAEGLAVENYVMDNSEASIVTSPNAHPELKDNVYN